MTSSRCNFAHWKNNKTDGNDDPFKGTTIIVSNGRNCLVMTTNFLKSHKFPKAEEDAFLRKQWEDNKTLIRVFAWVCLLHTIFFWLTYLIYGVIYTPILYFAAYGVWF